MSGYFLSFTATGNESALGIAEMIKNNKQLKQLSLGDFSFPKGAVHELAEAISSATDLEELFINERGYDLKDFQAMIPVAAACQKLTKVTFCYDKGNYSGVSQTALIDPI